MSADVARDVSRSIIANLHDAARQIRDTRRGDDAGEASAHVAFAQTARNLLGDPAAGLARIGSDQNLGLHTEPGRFGSEGHAGCVHSCRIERILAGNAADSVGPEKLFAH